MPDFRRPPDASSADALDDVRAAYERILELGASRACVGGDSAGGGLALAFAIKIRDAGATPDGRDGAWRLAPPAGCLAISPWVDLGEERIGGSRLSNERWDFLPGDMIDLLARETVEASGSDASHSVHKSNSRRFFDATPARWVRAPDSLVNLRTGLIRPSSSTSTGCRRRSSRRASAKFFMINK